LIAKTLRLANFCACPKDLAGLLIALRPEEQKTEIADAETMIPWNNLPQ
jgi:hypothetical protein